MTNDKQNGAVRGNLRLVLRIEGLAVLLSTLILYDYISMASWKIFFILFFVPDVSFLGYLAGKKVGAICYNLMHSYITPLFSGILFWYLSLTDLSYIILIWIAHIGFDRTLGYGLKYFDGFNYTHLGKIGSFKKLVDRVDNQ